MRSLCDKDKCTACGACENLCTQNAIYRQENIDGSWHMEINEKMCVNCGRCSNVCPNNRRTELNRPLQAYAAWSLNEKMHSTAASGGIASELYSYAVEQKMHFAGVLMNEYNEAHFLIGSQEADIHKFKNSKYTFSYMDDIYKKICTLLKSGEAVLFIGLPCQVAGVKNYMQMQKVSGKLYTVDLVCHGTPPPKYLKDHIAWIEKKTGKKAKSLYFRDPCYKTDKFAFTIYDVSHESIFEQTNLLSKKPTYIKYVGDNDLYQIGYHNALIYRECCYNCVYARAERSGDITLGDYHGLGKMSGYDHERNQVSCVLINTEQGKSLWTVLTQNVHIASHERPVDEPLTYEKQLKTPSVAPPDRSVFLEKYKESQNYNVSAAIAFSSYVKKNRIAKMFPVRAIKLNIIRAIPRPVKEALKDIRRKNSSGRGLK